MTRARNQQVSIEATPYYHCISRCVRRAFLCGEDPVSGANFDHRKVWLVEKMKELSGIFAVDICAYAVMSNHYHLVLHVNETQANNWSQEEVETRWKRLFRNNALLEEASRMSATARVANEQQQKAVAMWRNRLSDISWFMRCLNESIARRANREDECKGRFWEGRFRSQALLDEKALITCMAYVDLNPVRVGLCTSLDECDFTSIQERLVAQARRAKTRSARQKRLLSHFSHYFEAQQQGSTAKGRLMPLNSGMLNVLDSTLFFTQSDYVALLQWTSSRIQNKDSEQDKGAESAAHKLLQNLMIDSEHWLDAVKKFNKHFYLAAGSVDSLAWFQALRSRKKVFKHRDKWVRGTGPASRLFPN